MALVRWLDGEQHVDDELLLSDMVLDLDFACHEVGGLAGEYARAVVVASVCGALDFVAPGVDRLLVEVPFSAEFLQCLDGGLEVVRRITGFSSDPITRIPHLG